MTVYTVTRIINTDYAHCGDRAIITNMFFFNKDYKSVQFSEYYYKDIIIY